tara:strand:- start:145 stop:564 length:420 start_codon:yes stop_codon:yes gene_type:complete
MAIIGGAGNPVGGSFTGPAEALEIIGNHAYAFSSAGGQTVGEGEVTKLDFMSGISYYAVGTINAFTSDTSTHSYVVRIYFNEAKIIDGLYNNINSNFSDDMNPIPILIPPATQVKVTIQVLSASVDSASAQIVGRIYRD